MLPEFQQWVDEFVAIRRDIHAHPELAFEEHRTSDLIAAELQRYGVDHIERGLAGTGIVATIHGKHGAANDPDKAIALRADIDALPIHEETGLPYASTIAGKMHACGHDGHTAGLLMAAKYLAMHRNFSGSVHLIFQPAEEDGGGANIMIRDGLFKKFPVRSVWGMHNWPRIPTGVFVTKPGPIMAAVDSMTITVKGKGGHAAYPHMVIDPVLVGSHLVIALQSIVSRNVEPTSEAVVSVTCFHIGDADNVIAEKAELEGTIRSYDPTVRKLVHQRMQEICKGVADTFGATIKLNIESGYPATINSKAEAELAIEVAQSVSPHVITDFKPAMGAEDFAYMLEKVPGCYIGLGAGKTDNDPGLHHPQFDFNDDILPMAATYWVKLVEKNLPL